MRYGAVGEALTALSNRLHLEWSERLREETGIDNGYRRCGGIYFADNEHDARELLAAVQWWRERGIAVEEIADGGVGRCEPGLASAIGRGLIDSALFLPDEAQIRNPRHLKALIAACIRRGVNLSPGAEAVDVSIAGGRVEAVETTAGRIEAGQICLATGAWTEKLGERFAVKLAVKPIRGQLVLLNAQQRMLQRVINVGRRYLVPRDDGRILVGSTEEDVGFDRRTTAEAVSQLFAFALNLIPDLRSATFEQAWAGLRPASADGLPYLGRLPNLNNAFVAAGHFRSGLQLSPGTAVVLAQLMCGETPALDLTAFDPGRAAANVPFRHE
jgi:glycine oxidase